MALPTARASLTPPRPWLDNAFPIVNSNNPYNNPIIEGGDFVDSPPYGLWNDPNVIKVGSAYWMYMTTSTDNSAPFLPPVEPFRATSSDGISWTLAPTTKLFSTAGSPFVSHETPSVINFDGAYHMYYTGKYADGTFAIGHASSSDGSTSWTNHGLLLAPTGDDDDFYGTAAAEPAAVLFDSKLYLYFTGVTPRKVGGVLQYTPQKQVLGLMTSTDGSSFTTPVEVLAANEDKYPPNYGSGGSGNPNKRGYVGYSTPSAAVSPDGNMHLMYDVAVFGGSSPTKPYQQILLNHSVSSNGTSGWVEDAADMTLDRKDFYWSGGRGRGDDAEVIGPSLMFDSDGKVKMWWTGHDDVVGLAEFIDRGYEGPEAGAIGYSEMLLADFLSIPKST
tara:strand:- start:719 stop:1885 length:1167 start_codon:yes stop_codon:yes gene_type:complete